MIQSMKQDRDCPLPSICQSRFNIQPWEATRSVSASWANMSFEKNSSQQNQNNSTSGDDWAQWNPYKHITPHLSISIDDAGDMECCRVDQELWRMHLNWAPKVRWNQSPQPSASLSDPRNVTGIHHPSPSPCQKCHCRMHQISSSSAAPLRYPYQAQSMRVMDTKHNPAVQLPRWSGHPSQLARSPQAH